MIVAITAVYDIWTLVALATATSEHLGGLDLGASGPIAKDGPEGAVLILMRSLSARAQYQSHAAPSAPRPTTWPAQTLRPWSFVWVLPSSEQV